MIRVARPDDRERIRDLQAWLAEPNPPLVDYAVAGDPLALVSTVAGEPVGYVIVLAGGSEATVAELAIAPGYRREGRASRLLAEAFERLRARGCDRVRLAVEPDNEAALALYGKAGFERVGRRPDFYADGSPAVVLARRL